MKFQALFFLLLLACMYMSLAQGSYGDCCMGHVRDEMKPNIKKRIESYRRQETDGDCNIRAVVFVMKRRSPHAKLRTVCANPEEPWVINTVRSLDGKV